MEENHDVRDDDGVTDQHERPPPRGVGDASSALRSAMYETRICSYSASFASTAASQLDSHPVTNARRLVRKSPVACVGIHRGSVVLPVALDTFAAVSIVVLFVIVVFARARARRLESSTRRIERFVHVVSREEFVARHRSSAAV